MIETKPYISDLSLKNICPKFKLKDPASSITHFIGFVFSIFMCPLLLIHSSYKGANLQEMISLGIFSMGMILLYGASSAYHSFNISKGANQVLKKLDHMMIFILIASSYTPVCTMIIKGSSGKILLFSVWILALGGIILKYFFVNCPKWFSSFIYIFMGWLCIFKLPAIYKVLPTSGFFYLVLGGIIYTIGGILYSLKLEKFNLKFKNFGSHEIFHIFVMAGNLCHYILMYKYLL